MPTTVVVKTPATFSFLTVLSLNSPTRGNFSYYFSCTFPLSKSFFCFFVSLRFSFIINSQKMRYLRHMLCHPSGSTSFYTAVSPTAGTQLVKLPSIFKKNYSCAAVCKVSVDTQPQSRFPASCTPCNTVTTHTFRRLGTFDVCMTVHR